MRYPMNIAIGDGSTTAFKLPNHADIYRPKAGTPEIYVESWGGTDRLYGTERTNKLIYSEDITQTTPWKISGILRSGNQTTAPDGTLTGDQITEGATTAAHYIYQQVTSATGSTTLSIFVKPKGRTWCVLSDGKSNTTKLAWFNLEGDGHVGTKQSLVGTCEIKACDNGWYRLRYTVTESTTTNYLQVNCAPSDGVYSYLGVSGTGLYIWGAQLEESGNLGQYIATAATAVAKTDYTLSNYDLNLATAPALGKLLSWDGSTLDRG